MKIQFTVLFLSILASCTIAQAEIVDFTILNTNDTHTKMLPQGRYGEIGGAARMATLIKYFRSTLPRTLLVDAGDWCEGTFFHHMGDTMSVELELRSMLNYDAVALGNHDYLYDPAFFYEKMTRKDPNLPVLCANIDFNAVLSQYPDFPSYFEPYRIFEIDGVRIGIFGLSTEEFLYPQFITPISILKPSVIAREMIDVLKNQEQVDIVIGLTHLGFEEDVELASRVSGMDLIVGGHSHTFLFEHVEVVAPDGNVTYIVQTGAKYKYLGLLELAYDTLTDKLLIDNYELLPIDERLQEDAEVATFLQDYKDEITAKYGNVYTDTVADANVDLVNHSTESPLGNLVCDAILKACQDEGYEVDMALKSENFLVQPIRAGNICSNDVFETLCYGWDPYEDKNLRVFIVEMKGSDLKRFFQMIPSMGLYISFSGGEIISDATGLGFPSFIVNGEDLNASYTYNVAMNNSEWYTANNLLPQPNYTDTGLEEWRIFKDYLIDMAYLDRVNTQIDGRHRSVRPDLMVPNGYLTFDPPEVTVGETVSITAEIWNMGEADAAGGKISFYYDPTPNILFDEQVFEQNNLIGEVALGLTEAFGGQPEIVTVDWDTTGFQPAHYNIYTQITEVTDDQGAPEVVVKNNVTNCTSWDYKVHGAYKPMVYLAGMADTSITQASGGTLTFWALPMDSDDREEIKVVKLCYQGTDTGIRLNDMGIMGDLGKGDGLFSWSLDIPAGVPPVRMSGFEIQAMNYMREWSEPWPYLNVE